MSALLKAIIALRPGVNCADVNGTLAGMRWDAPLPGDFTPPTQQEVTAEIARQAEPLTAEQKLTALGITTDDLRELLGLE